jgi:cell shape-determining protein MreD
MIYCFYIATSLFLVVLQTTVLPYVSLFNQFYDLLIPFIVYLALYRPVRETLPLVFLLGYLMDGLSGSPFGLYTTIYFWLFLGLRWVTTFLRVGNTLLIAFVVPAGVVMEAIVFFIALVLQGADSYYLLKSARIAVAQVLWSLVTGPLLLIGFHVLKSILDSWAGGFLARYRHQDTL